MCSGMDNVPCDELANSVVIFNKQVLRSCYIWYYLTLFSVLFLFFFLSQELNVSHSTFHLILARISIPPKKCHDSVGFRVDKSHTMLFFPSIFFYFIALLLKVFSTWYTSLITHLVFAQPFFYQFWMPGYLWDWKTCWVNIFHIQIYADHEQIGSSEKFSVPTSVVPNYSFVLLKNFMYDKLSSFNNYIKFPLSNFVVAKSLRLFVNTLTFKNKLW